MNKDLALELAQRVQRIKPSATLAVSNRAKELQAAGIKVKADLDEMQSPGAKFYEWELKGVPLRIELGARDNCYVRTSNTSGSCAR